MESNVGRAAGSAARALAIKPSSTFRAAGSAAWRAMPGRSQRRAATSYTCVHGPKARHLPARQTPALSGAPRAPASQSPFWAHEWCPLVTGQTSVCGMLPSLRGRRGWVTQVDGGGGMLFSISSPSASSCSWNFATLAVYLGSSDISSMVCISEAPDGTS